jgi:tetratricopeptide (TPR) repeat protein
MTMHNDATSHRGKTPLSTPSVDRNWAADPLTASPYSFLGQAEEFCKEGDAFFSERDWEGATECYRAAVALDADHPEARSLLVGALYRRAHARPDVASYMDETLAACEEALSLDCPDADHYLMRTLQDLGRQEEAYRLHETTTLDILTSCLEALTKPVAEEGQRGDLSDKLREINSLVTFGFRLFRAYIQESEGGPIDWAGYSCYPIDE